MRSSVKIKALQDAVIYDLTATPASRRYSSHEHPDPAAKGDEFYADCISTVVADVLRAHGFHRLHSLGEAPNTVTFGKLTENGGVQAVQLRWRRNADLFSPIRDLYELEIPVFPPKNVGYFMHRKAQ